MLPLIKGSRWVVVNVDMITGNIVSTDMEMINNKRFHKKLSKNYGGHKKHRNAGHYKTKRRQAPTKMPRNPCHDTSNRDIFFFVDKKLSTFVL